MFSFSFFLSPSNCPIQVLEPSPRHQLVDWDPDHRHNRFRKLFSSRPGPSFLMSIFPFVFLFLFFFFGNGFERVLPYNILFCIKTKMLGAAIQCSSLQISYSLITNSGLDEN